VQMGFFDVYDQYLVNILYDPRVRPGMPKDELAKLLPEVLLTVRAWVANANLDPGAQSRTSSHADPQAPCNCTASDGNPGNLESLRTIADE